MRVSCSFVAVMLSSLVAPEGRCHAGVEKRWKWTVEIPCRKVAAMPRGNAKDSPYQVQVLDRAVLILDTLAATGEDLSLFDLSERLDLHKSTIHRLLMVLERHRLVERHVENGKYGLGLKLFELGQNAFARLGIGERARPHL